MRLEVDNTTAVVPPPSRDNASNLDASKEALNMGIRSAQAGDKVNARIALLRATELDEKNESAWLWLASISEYPEELIAFLDNVLAINPENERAVQWMSATRALLSKTFVQRGTDAAEADQPMYAEDCFRKALEYDENCAAGWMWLASLSHEKMQQVAYLERVLKIEPENQAANNALASILANEEKAEFAEIKKAAFEGDALGSLAALERFCQRYPSNVDAWMLRSHLVLKPAEKIDALRHVLEINPKHKAAKHSFDSLNSMFADAEQSVAPVQEDVPLNGETAANEEFSEPIAAPVEELIFEPIKGDDELMQTIAISDEELKEMGVPEFAQANEPAEDWNRETEAFDVSSITVEDDIKDFDISEAIPMPSALPMNDEDPVPERTGFETTVQKTKGELNEISCAFCAYQNDVTAMSCASCLAVLSLSDLDQLLANSHADKYVIRKAVEKMEKDRSARPFDETEYTMLGIGHLNLKNFKYGLESLQTASKLNSANDVLRQQVQYLEARIEEIRLKDEAHAALVKSKTILVVDDSATVRKLIAGKLEKSGHEVFCCNSGAEALDQLKELTPDLVLLDIAMPDEDGYQVCRQIRGWVATANTPVVMISGKDGAYDMTRGESAGATGYITKPFGPETLMKAVEYYLAGGKDIEILVESTLAN